MPLSEVSFETTNPVGVHLALIGILEKNGYEIFLDNSSKIIADHSRSLTKEDHAVEIEFKSQNTTGHCVPASVTIRINHLFSKVYAKSIVNKLLQVTPKVKITSVKPKMSFNTKDKNQASSRTTSDCLEKDASSTIKGKWRCTNCGSENDIAVDLCENCGASRHSSWEPNASPDDAGQLEDNPLDSAEEDREDDDHEQSIY